MSEEAQLYDKGINIPRLKACWPDGQNLPPIIEQIGTMLKKEVWGSVGHVTMPGSRFNDYWTDGGADLWHQFGNFVHCPDGTEIALWFHEGAVPGAEPVVEIGSEGELMVIARNIKQFFRDWARDSGRHDMTLGEEDRTPERVAQWQAVAAKMFAILDATPEPAESSPVPELVGFIQRHAEAVRRAALENPVHQAIARLMDKHIPRGKPAWEYFNCQIAVAGSRMELLPDALPPDYTERAVLPEAEELVPLIFAAREERARGVHAPRGLWHSASLRIDAEGVVMIPADWEAMPPFEKGPKATRAEVEADLARFPRSARWRQAWMDELQ